MISANPVDLHKTPTPVAELLLDTPEAAMPKASTVWGRWVDLVMSTDPCIRPRMPLSIMAALLYLPVILMLNFHASWLGGSVEINRFITLYSLLGMFGFYPLLRSGYSQRFAEPSLSLLQMLYAEAGAVMLFHFYPLIQAPALQLLCLIQIFGLLRLRPLAAMTAGVSAILMLVFSLWVTTGGDLLGSAYRMERMTLGAESLVLLMLAGLSSRYSKLRLQLEQQGAALRDTIAQIYRLVTYDTLTGLYNRQYMQELLVREMHRSQRSGQAFCVALIDLDHFKRINDHFGHRVGDEVLCGFAAAARHSLRETDVIARWGGEEFLVLLTDTDPCAMAQIGLHRLIQEFSTRRLIPNGAKNLAQAAQTAQAVSVATFSTGVALYRPGETVEQVIERADKALYAAKAAGRNCLKIAPGDE